MSDFEKVTDVTATRNVATAESVTPLDGTTQSMGDPEQVVDQEAMNEQTLASQGVLETPADKAEDTAEGEYSNTPDPIANEVTEQNSFWNGFFGKP